MKRSVLINLICSMIATLVVLIGVLLVLVLTGNVEFEQKKLVISSASATAVYDGKTLSNNKWYLVEGELDEGHTISASVTGAQTSVGMSENYVNAKILDESGKDVTKKYAIEYRPGALQVRARELVIVADSKMKAYDSMPLVCAGYTLKSAAALMPGDQLRVTVEGSITEVGEVPNEITDYTITNERGQDTSRNYNVTLINGRLVVYDEETLVIETDSDTKVYDGTMLRNDNWTLTSGALQPNHSIKVTVIGAQLSAGNSENRFSVMIYDGNGVNVTDTYEIVSVPGTLVVSRAPVTVKSNSAEKAYDGSPLTEDGFEVSPAYLTERGFRFEPAITGSQTEVGTSSNTVQSCTVYDPADNDVTANFDISFSEGELTVTDREEYISPTSLVFQSGEATKIYDGAPLDNATWELVSGSLQEGHTAEVEMTGAEQTDAGSCDNTYTVVIRDAEGQNVTAEYDLTLNYGTLTVNPLEITVQADHAQKVYDATPLTADGCVVRPQHLDLTSKFDFEWQVIGSRIEIGESDNTVAYCRIYDEDGRDITHNFSIKKVVGTLRVVANEDELRSEITYSSGSASKTYDGTPLSCYEYELIAGELRDGHYAVPQFKTSEITKVDKVDNDFEVRIYDEETNEDVTDRYLIDYEFGTLEIFPKEITVTAGDAEKMYDGMPLEYGGFSVENTDSSDTSEPLGEGDKITADMDGSAFKEGDRVSNKVSSVTITNADGEDVTDCYEITTSDGTLSVTGPTGREIFRLTAIGQNPGNAIYLKQQSYGDYDPEAKRWSSAKAYDVLIGDGKSAYYLPGEVCRANSIGLSEMDVSPVGGVFALPYYAEYGEFDVQTDDARMVGDETQDYTVFYYDHNQYIIDRHAVRDAEWVAFEQEYARFVEENYLYVDGETAAFMENIITARGFDRMSDEDAIRAVAQYLKNPLASGLSYDMQYDRTIDQASNPVIAFMQAGKGVCRHYAQAATLMYRALGIPARYTVGFSAPGFTSDGLSTVTDREAHAWVEVYKNGIGWVWVEVTGGPMQTMKLTVQPTYTSQQYDRYDPAELFADQTVSGLNELTDLGYTYEAEISGSRTEPGKTTSEILQLIIRDPSGDEVYNKRLGTGGTLFEITYKTGTVHVYWSELKFTSRDRAYTYDGEAHGDTSFADIIFEGTLESEHHWDVKDLKTVTNFEDATDNSFSVTIVNAIGRSVYDEYKVTQTFGKLKITPKEVWVTTKTVICTEAELAARGGTLTCHEFESIEGLLEGHGLSCEFIGMQAERGSSQNLVDISKGKVVVKDQYGNDVTSNYSIAFEWGQLRVI